MPSFMARNSWFTPHKTINTTQHMSFSVYTTLSRQAWSELRDDVPLPLVDDDLRELSAFNEDISLKEVSEVYLPLSRLLNLHVSARQDLHTVRSRFLRNSPPKVPYIIGIAGSVAVGKSTTARLLQVLLTCWPHHPRVELVTTDGFLYPNATLEERGIMNRKGFPESYDTRRLIRFLADLKAGVGTVTAPIYSHLIYDIVPDEELTLHQPDVVIVEGLNVLQNRVREDDEDSSIFVSDYFDFSVYVDASLEDLRQWYIERFLKLRETAFQDKQSFFRHFAELTEEESKNVALNIWREINERNLIENILPTRERAHLILRKSGNHQVDSLMLRKI